MFRKESEVDTIATRLSGDSRPMRNVMVTGGCGFIGSNFINYFVREHPEATVFNVDKMDYCANMNSVEKEVVDSGRYQFIRGNICTSDYMLYIMRSCEIDTIVHFAAASHVDNSFGNSLSFTTNNIQGTHSLLECARVYGKIEKFIHVSTDEVYGEVTQSQSEGGFLNPTNPYAATKAGAEFLVKSYHISFGLPCIITRGNNVYGKYQYPEKVIPRFAMLRYFNMKLTIQGDGSNTRTFIHAEDVARAFDVIVTKGVIGEIYNIGSTTEVSVQDIAERVVREVHAIRNPDSKEVIEVEDHIERIRDRPFNDTRYDIDTSKLIALGWKEEIPFEEGFSSTVRWYIQEALPSKFWTDIRMDIQTEEVDHPKE